jgi:hypothetical protein
MKEKKREIIKVFKNALMLVDYYADDLDMIGGESGDDD